MKKRECIIVILLIFGISQIFAASCGDVNSDEVVDIVDALLIAQYYVNLDPANFNSTMADVNGDKDIDIVDALLVAQYYVELISTLDRCEQLIEPVTIELQAEDATWDNGSVGTTHTGYTGSGFVDTINASGTWIEWSLDVANDTNALCVFRYACASDNRAMELSINGNPVASLSFPASGEWTTWVTDEATGSLNTGSNTIRLIATTSGGAPNMDKMDITVNIPPPTPTPTVPPATPSPTTPPFVTPSGIPDFVVARDGSGDYTSVQPAIDTVPDNGSNWFTIYIKNGTYYEKINIPVEKTFLRLIGESASGTILTYDHNSGDVGSTWGTASTFVYPNDFIAANLTFENTNSSSQAVALEPLGQRQAFFNCRVTGYQDTLYFREQCRVFFQDCYIQGHTDFIFGDGTVIFENCEIRSRNKSAAITAASTLEVTPYGLIFINCHLTGDSGLSSNRVYLGRPWHPSSVTESVRSNVVYLYCEMDAHIRDDGWTTMGGVSPDTERYFEYQNTGPGAKVNSSRPQLNSSEAPNYTVDNILGGPENWDPTTLPY